MSCFTTGGPGKERRTNKPPPTRRVQERSKGDTTCLTTSRILLSGIHLGWTRHAPPGRTLNYNDWLKTPETNPITIKSKTVSHVTELFLGSLTLLLSTQVPFPNKISCFVSTCVSSDNSFLSVRQEPSFRPWKGSPFLQHIFSHNPQ